MPFRSHERTGMLAAHISDLHLGRTSPGDPHGGERLHSFRQCLATLMQCNPDVILVAGDTFDSPRVNQAIIEEAGQSLAALKNTSGEAVPVVIVPGNHDPADADKLWAEFRDSV